MDRLAAQDALIVAYVRHRSAGTPVSDVLLPVTQRARLSLFYPLRGRHLFSVSLVTHDHVVLNVVHGFMVLS